MTDWILFDCDGTLLRKPGIDETFRDFAKRECGADILPELLRQAREDAAKDMATRDADLGTDDERRNFYRDYNRKVLEQCGVVLDADGAVRLFDHFQKIPFALFPDTLPTLQWLATERPEIALGILSNWTFTLPQVLRDTGIDGYFRIVAFSQELGVSKPDPEAFTKTLARLGPHGRVFYVGDSYELDILPTTGVGIEPIFLDRTGVFRDRKTENQRIETLAELRNIFR